MKRFLSLSSLLVALGMLLMVGSCKRDSQKNELRLHGLSELTGKTAYLYDESKPETPIDSIVIK